MLIQCLIDLYINCETDYEHVLCAGGGAVVTGRTHRPVSGKGRESHYPPTPFPLTTWVVSGI